MGFCGPSEGLGMELSVGCLALLNVLPGGFPGFLDVAAALRGCVLPPTNIGYTVMILFLIDCKIS